MLPSITARWAESVVGEFVQQVFEREQVTLAAESGNDADGQVRRNAGEFSGAWTFERWTSTNGMATSAMASRRRNAGVRVGRRIDDDEADALAACGVDALDQRAFVVALEGFQFDARSFRPARQCAIDVGQRRGAIVLPGSRVPSRFRFGP